AENLSSTASGPSEADSFNGDLQSALKRMFLVSELEDGVIDKGNADKIKAEMLERIRELGAGLSSADLDKLALEQKELAKQEANRIKRLSEQRKSIIRNALTGERKGISLVSHKPLSKFEVKHRRRFRENVG